MYIMYNRKYIITTNCMLQHTYKNMEVWKYMIKFICDECKQERLIYSESRLNKILQKIKMKESLVCRFCLKEQKDSKLQKLIENIDSEKLVIR